MTGTIATPSDDIIACATGEGEVYNCSKCNEAIPLAPNQKLRNICQAIQDHLEQCMPSKTSRESPNGTPAPTFVPLVNLCMPLQPRRTWSAEDERRRRLEEDPDAYDVGPHSVTCAGCHRPIRLNATGRYYAANWNKHKMGCKNTNAVSGAGAIAADSKFTGRVAAFRVAKPSEDSEPFTHSSTSRASDEGGHFPQSQLKRAPASPSSSAGPGMQPSAITHDVHHANQVANSRRPTADGYFVLDGTNRADPQKMSMGILSPYSQPRTVPSVETHSGQSYATVPATPLKPEDEESLVRLRGLKVTNKNSGRFALLNSDSFSTGTTGYEHGGPVWSTHGRIGEKERSSPGSSYLSVRGLPHPRDESDRHGRNALRTSREVPTLRLPQRTLPMPLSAAEKGKGRLILAESMASPYPSQPPPPYWHTYAPPYKRLVQESQEYQFRQPSSSLQYGRDKSGLSGRIAPRTGFRDPRDLNKSHYSTDSGRSTPLSALDLDFVGRRAHIGIADDAGSSGRALTHKRNDSVTLPSLSSFALPHIGSTSPALSAFRKASLACGPTGRGLESYTSANANCPPLSHHGGKGWRQHNLSRPWAGRGATDDSESVLLPPIRAIPLGMPDSSPTGTKRRLREGEGNGESAMDEDRPSPPKVFVQPGRSSNRGVPGTRSVPSEDDTLSKYRLSQPAASRQSPSQSSPALRSTNTGRKSLAEVNGMGVPPPCFSQERSDEDATDGNAARLHPVWKWEQQARRMSAS